MADVKISALPASTTPLAGTEVLPIVQSGATKQVSVANLTAGRAISATSVTASTGNFVVGTSGQGVDFSATPGTGTSELLADYEEGAWTPALSDGTNSSSFAANSGWYTKVGNLVTVNFSAYNLDVSGLSATTQPLRVTGLPFTSSSKGAYNAAALPLNLSGENLFLVLGGSATSIFINRATGTVDSTSLTRTGAGSPNNMSVYGQISYNV